MAAVLVGLNAASYTQRPKEPDNEALPNRSSFNPGATGTQAFYTLLAETGHKVVRWQEPPGALLTAKPTPTVFVVVGNIRREFTPVEIEELMQWVSSGGRLILIDREPTAKLVLTTANWSIDVVPADVSDALSIDPSDQNQMTADTSAAKGVQPSILTAGVIAVQPSRFASSIVFEKFEDETSPRYGLSSGPGTGYSSSTPPPSMRMEPDEEINSNKIYTMPKSPPVSTATTSDADEGPDQTAPVVHLTGGAGDLLVDAPYGLGRIVFLSDPFIVANGGIGMVDNAQLAINLVATDGVVAFDEFHQGYGSGTNRFIEFFAGTPVIAIFLQAAILVGLVFYSKSRRFARPVPEPEPDRLSKLEYVAAMAELQNRTRAFDLAIENIYNDFRRRVTRYFGLDNFTVKPAEIAARVAERTGRDKAAVETILFACEEIVRGEPASKKGVVKLTSELRDIEKELGLTRGPRSKL